MILHVGQVATEAGFVLRFVGRLIVYKAAEPPTARRGIFLRILDHELHCRRLAGDERLNRGGTTLKLFKNNAILNLRINQWDARG